MKRPFDNAVFPGARILIIDDDAQSAVLVDNLLRRAGYAAVEAVQDPTDVIATLTAAQPDLVILDLHMPFPDGFILLEHIRLTSSRDTYLPILVVTADVSATTKYRALAIGATDFVAKPLDVVEVQYRVRNLLQTRLLFLELQRTRMELAARLGEAPDGARAEEEDGLGW